MKKKWILSPCDLDLWHKVPNFNRVWASVVSSGLAKTVSKSNALPHYGKNLMTLYNLSFWNMKSVLFLTEINEFMSKKKDKKSTKSKPNAAAASQSHTFSRSQFTRSPSIASKSLNSSPLSKQKALISRGRQIEEARLQAKTIKNPKILQLEQ